MKKKTITAAEAGRLGGLAYAKRLRAGEVEWHGGRKPTCDCGAPGCTPECAARHRQREYRRKRRAEGKDLPA